MTKRERNYLWRKKHKALIEFQRQVFDSILFYNIAASKVWEDENDNVQMKVLTIDECYELKEKIENGEIISQEYTLANSEDILFK